MLLEVQTIEDALADQGWEPEYYSADERLFYNPYFELLVEDDPVFVELVDADESMDIPAVSLVRITSLDESGQEKVDVWDIEDFEETEEIVGMVKEYHLANFR